VRLPPELNSWLSRGDGLELFDGHVRIFGVGQAGGIDSVAWNDVNCWKFAWGKRACKYWCFGESAWGDQFALETEKLAAERDPLVHTLFSLTMIPMDYKCSLRQFLKDQSTLYDNADWFDKQIRQKFPKVESDMHLIYVPPVSMIPPESEWNVAFVSKMNARTAMICNGDIALQEELWPSGATPAGLETYQDDQERTRVKIIWKKEREGQEH
jgi:hypothetical protein